MARLLLRYGEIALKGKNRPYFEKKLLQNIKTALQGLEPFEVTFQRGRFFVDIAEEMRPLALKRLQHVFGIVSISPVYGVEPDLEAICRQARELMEKDGPAGKSFKVETRRADKRFPHTSPQVNKEVGAYILKNIPAASVDVHNPDVTVSIEIRENRAYLYTEMLRGPGGLPVGVTGRGMLLLSGGIDSPVAGWMALKRGIELQALHFHSPPFTGEGALNKVTDICRLLASYSGHIKLHLAPFTEVQKQIRLLCPETMTITLMRRAMFRAAEKLAAKEKITVLFTGESLGQVASQTLENMVAIDEVTAMPVLRPLVGLDKEEITSIARKAGTYEISIRPFEDCCTLFVPRHPVTRPSVEELRRAEQKLDLEELIDTCVDNIESRIIKKERS